MTTKKLATFRVGADEWEAFQQWAKRHGTTASALLVDYIEQCLDKPATKPSAIRLEQMAFNLANRIDNIDQRLNLLETSLSRRIQEIVRQQMASLTTDRTSVPQESSATDPD